jgi:hypothetical protein
LCGTCEWDLWDEITGLPLLEKDVLDAQLKEMKEYERFEVAVEVDDSEAWEITGEGPVASRWKVINKGDAANVDVRARLIAKRFKKAGADSIFAPTPPLAGFRLLCSSAVTRRPDDKKRKLFVIDIKRAFFHAQARSRPM